MLKKAVSNKVLKTNRVRADTTVVPGDVGYPTDSGLLARGVVRLTALVATLHVLGLATRTKPGTGAARCAGVPTTSGRGCGAGVTWPKKKRWR